MSIEDEELEAAILFPRVAVAMVEIVKKCHHPLGQLARLEAERLRQQERANKEAVDFENYKEEVRVLLEECIRSLVCNDRGRHEAQVKCLRKFLNQEKNT